MDMRRHHDAIMPIWQRQQFFTLVPLAEIRIAGRQTESTHAPHGHVRRSADGRDEIILDNSLQAGNAGQGTRLPGTIGEAAIIQRRTDGAQMNDTAVQPDCRGLDTIIIDNVRLDNLPGEGIRSTPDLLKRRRQTVPAVP